MAKNPHEDPLSLIARTRTWLHSRWLGRTYPFASYGNRVSIHYSCDVLRSVAPQVKVGNNVYLAPHVWLNVAPGNDSPDPKIVLGNGCAIGRRSNISARNFIELEENVLFAPGVFIMDHNHEFSDLNRSIYAQGVTEGGKITIEKNCWLGYLAVVLCGKGELRVGRNSVIGAHAVVTRSVPPFSVVVGNPARVVKFYDPEKRQWIRTSDDSDKIVDGPAS